MNCVLQFGLTVNHLLEFDFPGIVETCLRLLKVPKRMVLPLTSRPRLPRTHQGPKWDSSDSISLGYYAVRSYLWNSGHQYGIDRIHKQSVVCSGAAGVHLLPRQRVLDFFIGHLSPREDDVSSSTPRQTECPHSPVGTLKASGQN